MNGLQSISFSACKRFRQCPPGTRGRVLSQQLALGTQSAPAVARKGPAEESNAFSPLDTSITGLTPMFIPRRDPPIRKLLLAIGNSSDAAIWHYFMQAHNQGLTHQLSAGEFSSVLLSLRPKRYLSLRQRHYLDEYGNGQVHKKTYSFKELRAKLRVVAQAMQRRGHRLGVIEYCHLLDCARAGGDLAMVDDLWHQINSRKDLVLDTWTYNCYLAAKVGTAATHRGVRMTEWVMQNRTGTAKKMRLLASDIYARMVRESTHPNSMTYDLLIMAMSRVGDTGGVKELLKRVWGVDVNGLARSDNNLGFEPPTVSPDSDLYPTKHTLTMAAMCFGSNNDIETAIRVVDHISRRYRVPISLPAWINLLIWTYTFTRPPAHTMPAQSVAEIWEIMTAPPYNVQPTIEMYDYLVRSLIRRKCVSRAEDKMKEAVQIYVDVLKRAVSLEQKHDAMPGNTEVDDAAVAQADALKEVAVARRESFRFRSMIRRWAELLILGKGMNPGHGRRKVPDIVAGWKHFLGGKAIYVIDSGYVVLDLGNEREWTPMSIRRRKRPWTPLGTGAKEVDYLD